MNEENIKIPRPRLKFIDYLEYTVVGLIAAGSLFILISAFSFIGGCAHNSRTSLNQDVWMKETAGPSPYHRTLFLFNTNEYDVEVDVTCTYSQTHTFVVPTNYSIKRVVYTPTPRQWRGFFSVCDISNWKRYK